MVWTNLETIWDFNHLKIDLQKIQFWMFPDFEWSVFRLSNKSYSDLWSKNGLNTIGIWTSDKSHIPIARVSSCQMVKILNCLVQFMGYLCNFGSELSNFSKIGPLWVRNLNCILIPAQNQDSLLSQMFFYHSKSELLNVS